MKALKVVIAWVKGNPTRTAAIAVVILGWLASAGVPDTVVGGLGTILSVLLGTALHGAVMPLATAEAQVEVAAGAAAQEVAEQLTDVAAGVVGEVTPAAAEVVADATTNAVNSAMTTLSGKHKK